MSLYRYHDMRVTHGEDPNTISIATTCDDLLAVEGLVPAICAIKGISGASISLGRRPGSTVSPQCRCVLNVRKLAHVPWSESLKGYVLSVLRDKVIEHDRKRPAYRVGL